MRNCIYTLPQRPESDSLLSTTIFAFPCSKIPTTAQHSTFFFYSEQKIQTTTVKMDAIVQAILNLSKLEVSLIKIEDATPE